MTIRPLALGAVTVLLVAGVACSGDDDASSTTTSSVSTSEAVPSTTEPPATTTEPPSTTAPPATTDTVSTTEPAAATTEAPSTTAPANASETLPTTAPPSTVLMSSDGAVAAVQALFDRWTDCLAVMPECDPVAVSTNLAMGTLSDQMYISADIWSEEGATFENLESRRLVIESVEIDETDGLATVVTCTDDGAVRLGPDGSVLDDSYLSLRQQWELITDGTKWIGTIRNELERVEGEGNELCASD